MADRKPLVTILVPNYKTLELTQLCLRLLRKYTPADLADVLVIDNDSADESLAYLRTLSWIRLIERKSIPGEPPAQSHSRALDLGLDQVTTPYVLSIHTDTLIKHPQWLTFLINKLTADPQIAAVGSWKLEFKPFWKRFLKKIERAIQLRYYQFKNKSHQIEGIGENYYYLRSHCALYRTDLLRQFNLHFADGDQVAGKAIHKQLVDAGYQMVFLPSEILVNYLEHINHATLALNPHLDPKQKKMNKEIRRVEKSLSRMDSQMILQDARLDQ